MSCLLFYIQITNQGFKLTTMVRRPTKTKKVENYDTKYYELTCSLFVVYFVTVYFKRVSKKAGTSPHSLSLHPTGPVPVMIFVGLNLL